MIGELGAHPRPVHLALGGVVEDVQLHRPAHELAHAGIISITDIELRFKWPAKGAKASRYRQAVLKWLRHHPRLADLAIIGGTAALSVSLTGELGVVTAVALGMAVILIANLLLGRLPSG